MRRLPLLLLFIAKIALAHEDYFVPWRAVTLDLATGAHVRVSTVSDGLGEITVTWTGKTFRVPKSEFEVVPWPLLNTVKVLSDVNEVTGTKAAYLVVRLQYGAGSPDGYPQVDFMFDRRGYQKLVLRARVSPSTLQLCDKLAGKPATEGRPPQPCTILDSR